MLAHNIRRVSWRKWKREFIKYYCSSYKDITSNMIKILITMVIARIAQENIGMRTKLKSMACVRMFIRETKIAKYLQEFTVRSNVVQQLARGKKLKWPSRKTISKKCKVSDARSQNLGGKWECARRVKPYWQRILCFLSTKPSCVMYGYTMFDARCHYLRNSVESHVKEILWHHLTELFLFLIEETFNVKWKNTKSFEHLTSCF